MAAGSVRTAAEAAVSRLDELVDDFDEAAKKALDLVATQAANTMGYER